MPNTIRNKMDMLTLIISKKKNGSVSIGEEPK